MPFDEHGGSPCHGVQKYHDLCGVYHHGDLYHVPCHDFYVHHSYVCHHRLLHRHRHMQALGLQGPHCPPPVRAYPNK